MLHNVYFAYTITFANTSTVTTECYLRRDMNRFRKEKSVRSTDAFYVGTYKY